jgi:hypothetical protein
MIRRDTTTDATPAWIIIPQVEHARLSGQLAEAFDTARFALLGDARLRGQLLDAIYRHDDGWAAWDPFLQLDPDAYAPRQFTEMLTEELVSIWLRSIHGVGVTHPLGGHIVARHFATLLDRHLAELPADDPERTRGEQFAARLDAFAADYLARWQAESPPVDAAAAWPARCLGILQAFDYVSLWFCCRERPEPLELDIDGSSVRFTAGGEGRVTVTPWPFADAELTVHVRGQAIPARPYHSNAELATVGSTPALLTWQLLRGAEVESNAGN